jgi:hypothetical protein
MPSASTSPRKPGRPRGSVAQPAPPLPSRPVIDPEAWYGPRDFAAALLTGPKGMERAKSAGLRCVAINGRGDQRSRGSWILQWLEAGGFKRPQPHGEAA